MIYHTLLVLCVVFCYSCTASLTITQPTSPASERIRYAYVFERGSWIESIAARPNGQLLITRLDIPELWLVECTRRDIVPVLLYRFSNVQALTGVVEIAPDVFAVSAGNYTLGSGPTPGSWSVWRVDLSGYVPPSPSETPALPESRVSKIADVPEVAHLKAMTRLSGRYVLFSDFRAGVVYRLHVDTGAYEVVIADGLTAAVTQPIFDIAGVSGLHLRDGDLYFTNTGQNILAKIPIHADGTPAGAASIVAHTAGLTDYFDGFTFGAHGDIYLGTGAENTVVRLPQSGGPQVHIAGDPGSSLIAEPTALAFGRGVEDQGVLYVVTGGGLLAPTPGRGTSPARLVAIEVGPPY